MEIIDLEKLLQNNLDENNPNTQKMYQQSLDKIIDASLFLKYKEDKKKSIAYTLDQVHAYIICYFNKIDFYNQDYILTTLAQKISYMTQRKNEIPYYFTKLKSLYESYLLKQNNNPTDFYNEILNKQQNAYLTTEKKKIIEFLKFKMPINDKKRQTIKNGIKLDIILKNEFIEELKITPDELNGILTKAHTILDNKKSLKHTHILTEENYDFYYLDYLFINNQLTDEKIIERFSFYNKRQIKLIKNAYTKQIIQYLQEIELEKGDIDILYVSKSLKFSSNHLKFYSKEKEIENIRLFLNTLEPKEQTQIITQIEDLQILKFLLPLVNIFDDFDMRTFKNIVLYFPKIKDYLMKESKLTKKITINQILNNLSTIIELGNVYSNVDNPYVLSILGEEIIKTVIKDNLTSSHPEIYLYVYIQMLENYKSTIPPISGEFGEYIYENGTSNIERLLIGKNVFCSCIGPAGAGEEAYYESLCEKTADVLIVKKKDTEEFVARSLMFRRGNFLIFAPFYDERGIDDNFYNKEFLSKISNQILEDARQQGDKLEYVFITHHHCLKQIFPFYEDSRFYNCIPHCDIEAGTFLLNSTVDNIELNPLLAVNTSYLRNRASIQRKKTDYIKDMKKILSLNIQATHGLEFNFLEEEFDYIENLDLDEVYIGQDWYIAVKDSQIISKCAYKVEDERQELEINTIINDITKKEEKGSQKIYINKH